jgi:hypothetical protein
MSNNSTAIRTLILVGVLCVTGCASVTRGTNDLLEITTTPAQAQVEIVRLDRGFTPKELKRNVTSDERTRIDAENNGKPAVEQFSGPIFGVTPAVFSLARKGEYTVTLSKDGYLPATVEIKNKVSGAGSAGMAGNVLIGGIIGAGIDAGTGAMLNLTPNPVTLELEPIQHAAVEGDWKVGDLAGTALELKK